MGSDIHFKKRLFDNLGRIPVIATILATLVAMIPLVVLFVQGYSFGDLLFPFLGAIGFLVVASIVVTSLCSRVSEPLREDVSSVLAAAAALAGGNLLKEQKTNFEELSVIEKDLQKLSSSLKSIIAETKNLGTGKIIDNRIFPGEFKDVANTLNKLVGDFANKEKQANERVQTGLRSLTSEIKNATGSFGTNRQIQKLSVSSYSPEWKEMAEALEMLFEESEKTFKEKSDEIGRLTKQVGELKRQVENLSKPVVRPSPPPLPTQRASSALSQNFATTPRVTANRQFPKSNFRTSLTQSRPSEASGTGINRNDKRTIIVPVKGAKANVPSGAHEYDRKDFGKY